MDPEFDGDKYDSLVSQIGPKMNICGTRDHCPLQERNTRVIKERIRCLWSVLPYRKHVPKGITIGMVNFTIMWLNGFPRKGGISKTISPRMLTTGVRLDYNTHCRCEFGALVQTHDDPLNKNDAHGEDRSTGAICLGPTGNQQGTYYFYSLNTKRLFKAWKLDRDSDDIRCSETYNRNW